MKGDIELLVGETGCDRAQAELALQICGYDIERAIQEIPSLLRDLLVLKIKFRSDGPLYSLLLAVVNLKSVKLLRLRSVVSYHPAVWMTPLDGEWFEFEKHLYACRLWEGSLQQLSQETERQATAYFRSSRGEALIRDLRAADAAGKARSRFTEFLEGVLRKITELEVRTEILSLSQYQSLRREPAAPGPRLSAGSDNLVLRVALEGDPSGPCARDLRVGDLVFTQIIDPRDIAQYLAKLFGGRSEAGLVPLLAPIESVEPSSDDPGVPIVRVRFAVGVSGELRVPPDIRVRVQKEPVAQPWWRKWFNSADSKPGG